MSTSVTDSAALSMGRAEWVAGRSAVPEPPAHGIKDAVAGVYKKNLKKSKKTRPTKNVICKIDQIPKLFNIFICDSEGAPSS